MTTTLVTSSTEQLNPLSDETLCQSGRMVIATEAKVLESLVAQVNENFAAACRLILAIEGRVVVTGMGKSGHIARKIAATLASVGTPAFFLHPGEASHGDLGMITRSDILLALSNSGETDELLTILPLIKRMGVSLISFTGNPKSKLARASDVHLNVGVEKEACPLGLAPTASTTAALAMGDALAIALLEAQGFGPEQFALSHPGGRLGRRLLVKVSDVMHTGDTIPVVTENASLSEVLIVMTAKSLGMAIIVDEENKVLGLFTDGDLRRVVDNQQNIHEVAIGEFMTTKYTSIHYDVLASEGALLMEQKSINALPVVDERGILVGAFNMHDLLRAGVL